MKSLLQKILGGYIPQHSPTHSTTTPNKREFLSYELRDLALNLKQNTPQHLIESQDIFITTAFMQITEHEQIVFSNASKAKSIILGQLKQQTHYTGNQIAEKVGGFEWGLFDQCLKLCNTHELYDCTFYDYQIIPPTIPNIDDKKSLEILTIPQIKQLLKVVGQPLSGKRDELVNRLWLYLPINDTINLLNQKYQEQLALYEKRHLANKYSILISHIKHRAYFLNEIVHALDIDNPFLPNWSYKIDTIFCQEQDDELVRLLHGFGYDDIVSDGKITKILPLFPCDKLSVHYSKP